MATQPYSATPAADADRPTAEAGRTGGHRTDDDAWQARVHGLVRALDPWCGALLGVAVFLVCFGTSILRPTNVGWLMQVGDTAQAFIADLFYLFSPWEWPLGRNSQLGMEVGTSIGFTGSVPLVAIPLKALAPILPFPFQYYGLWLLLCFALQGLFAWLLMGRITDRPLLKAIGSCFFLFSFPLWARMVWNQSLAAHWVILAALWLYTDPRPRFIAWAVLLLAAVAIHPYFLMIGAIWAADVVRRLWTAEISVQRAGLAAGLALASLWLGMWQSGYFVVPGSKTGGGSFGLYRMNLLSPLDPSWVGSFVLKDLPETTGDYEGFNYLGLGVIVLSMLAIYELCRRRESTRMMRTASPLIAVCVALTLFALSNKVVLGKTELLTIPLPERVAALCEVFRSSGRFFWPVYYVLFWSVLWVVIRRNTARTAAALCGLGLVLQLGDGWPDGLFEMRDRFRDRIPTWSQPLRSEFWDDSMKRYDRIYFAPPIGFGLGDPDFDAYMAFAYLAAQHRIPMNSGMFARYDGEKWGRLIAKFIEDFRAGIIDPRALYVFRREDLGLWDRALELAPTTGHQVAVIDGFRVLAPAGGPAAGTAAVPSPPAGGDPGGEPDATVGLGQPVRFGANGNGVRFLRAGWSVPEAWGTWSDGELATIDLPLRTVPKGKLDVAIDAYGYVPTEHPRQTIEVLVNDTPIGVLAYESANDGGVRRLRVPDTVRVPESGLLTISFRIPDAAAPSALGVGADTRRLGMHIGVLTVTEVE